MHPSSMRFPLPLVLGVLVALAPLASAARANDVDAAQSTEQRGLQQRLSERLFNGIKALATKLAAKLTSLEHCDLTITNMDRDERNRMYIDFDGECDLAFPILPGKLKSWMEALPGHHMSSDGPLNVDYTVTTCEMTGDKNYHVEFRVKLIIVLEEVLAQLVRFGSTVVGTVTLLGVGNDLAAVVEGINGETVGQALGDGLREMPPVLMGLAGVEAYDGWRGFRADRANIGQGQSSAGMICMHLAGAILKGAVNVTTRLAGMSIGAAIGTALFPGLGSTVGALAGAAGFTIVGNIVYSKLTVDLPIAYRLGRIRRMTERLRSGVESADFNAYLQGKIETQELKLLKRFSLELRTDKFGFYDQLVGAFKAMPADRQVLFGSLRKKIEQKLQFEVVNRGDKLMAWKLDQLRVAFGDKPLTAGR